MYTFLEEVCLMRKYTWLQSWLLLGLLFTFVSSAQAQTAATVIPIPKAYRVAADSSTQQIYVGGDAALYVLDAATNQIIHTISFSESQIHANLTPNPSPLGGEA
jgi:hypothetical protein